MMHGLLVLCGPRPGTASLVRLSVITAEAPPVKAMSVPIDPMPAQINRLSIKRLPCWRLHAPHHNALLGYGQVLFFGRLAFGRVLFWTSSRHTPGWASGNLKRLTQIKKFCVAKSK